MSWWTAVVWSGIKFTKRGRRKDRQVRTNSNQPARYKQRCSAMFYLRHCCQCGRPVAVDEFIAVAVVTSSRAAESCYPDTGEWICMYRNYFADPDFGGSSKCLKLQRYGKYENFTSPVVFTFGHNGSTSGIFHLTSSPCYTGKDLTKFTPDDESVPLEDFYSIYIDCSSCLVIRHRYVENGFGCSLWRRVGTLRQPNDCCEFVTSC
uniref:Uncharacterized protein n=1 Tax=Amblyomma maculatum TaxID=34609 RepID=G3MTV4_AMBMU